MILKIIFLTFCFKIGSFRDVKDMTVDELLKLGKDITQPVRKVSKHDVKYYFFTRNNSSEKVDSKKPIKVLIHGWLENHQNSWYDKMTSEYLIKGDFVIIQLDWEKAARATYISSAKNSKSIGHYLGQFLLQQKYSPENIHLIGHSLGAHVAGFAAKVFKRYSERIHRITGLDPAGPYFEELLRKSDRLNSEDADIVDVIHTDSGFYGFERPIGTLDIYVNGGSRIQPGCLKDLRISSAGEALSTTFCSHTRSYKYFTESIRSRFSCRTCSSLGDALIKHCKGELYRITAEEISNKTTGICFVKTNSKEPFFN